MAGFNHRWYKVLDYPAPIQKEWGWDNNCCARQCRGQQVVALAIYDYITGRRGRVSDRRQYLCQAHLDAWLKKNPEAKQGLDLRWNKDKAFVEPAQVAQGGEECQK